MKNTFVQFILLMTLFIQCKRRSNETSNYNFHFFNAHNLSSKELLANGFSVDQTVDVFRLGREINDSTTLQYMIGNDSLTIITEEWRVRTSKFDLGGVTQFLTGNGVYPITPLCPADDYIIDFDSSKKIKGTDVYYIFCCQDSRTNRIYQIKYNQEDDLSGLLEITFFYPREVK